MDRRFPSQKARRRLSNASDDLGDAVGGQAKILGARIRACEGDLLFEIDPRPFEAAALDEARSQLDQAKAVQLATEADFERSQDLFNKKVISEQEFENKKQLNLANVAKVGALEAAVETAQLNLGFTKISAPVDGIAGAAKAQIGDLVGPGSTATLTTVSKIDPIRLYFPLSEKDYKQHANALQKAMQRP